MKMRYIFFMIILALSIGAASAYMPHEGTFAYREVENHTLHGINFTVPDDFTLNESTPDMLYFTHGKEKLKITAEKNGKIKKVNSTKKVKASRTMLGSQKGYLVEKNRKYTFSYRDGDYLVVIKSSDIPLMIGVMGKD